VNTIEKCTLSKMAKSCKKCLQYQTCIKTKGYTYKKELNKVQIREIAEGE